MSVCNIFVGEDHILCLSDTLRYNGGVPEGLVRTKCRIADTGQFAWTFRGSSIIGTILETGMNGLPSFDEAAEMVPEFLALFPEEAWKHTGDLTIMGWSADAEELRAARWRIAIAGGIEEHCLLGRGFHLFPAGPDGMRFPEEADEPLMVKLALVQHKVQERFKLPLCIGGVMHLTIITEAGAEQRIVGAYPDYDKHAKAFGCPNARDWRRFRESQRAAA